MSSSEQAEKRSIGARAPLQVENRVAVRATRERNDAARTLFHEGLRETHGCLRRRSMRSSHARVFTGNSED